MLMIEMAVGIKSSISRPTGEKVRVLLKVRGQNEIVHGGESMTVEPVSEEENFLGRPAQKLAEVNKYITALNCRWGIAVNAAKRGAYDMLGSRAQ